MAEILYPLALLACPLGMGVMMWVMMRHGHQHDANPNTQISELTELRAELDQLRATQHDSGSVVTQEPRTPTRQRSGGRSLPPS